MTADNKPTELEVGDADSHADFENADLSDLDGLQQELNQALEENAQLKDAVLRAKAETENIRRRSQEEVSKAHKFGIEGFAESLLAVKDSLEAALAQENQTLQTWQEGVELTHKQLISAFERHRLVEIAPEVGEAFNPNLHQAISSVPVEGQASNTVVSVLQKGALIADRVLRPALVMVAA